MEIRISRQALVRVLIALGLPAFILVMYWMGMRVTPYTTTGAPVLLSPSLRGSIAYRRQAVEWTRRLREVDQQLVKLQSDRQQDVYEQTRQAEVALSSALQIAQEIEIRHAPSALAGLRTLLLDASQRYYATAQAAAQWVGAPTPDHQDTVAETLVEARAALSALSASRWLIEEQAPQTTPRAGQSPDLELPAP
jgi:hypothetical protein